jgi:hypothetical protein
MCSNEALDAIRNISTSAMCCDIGMESDKIATDTCIHRRIKLHQTVPFVLEAGKLIDIAEVMWRKDALYFTVDSFNES